MTAPRTQGKDNRFWTGFPLRSFFMRKDCGGRKLFVLKHSCNWLLPETRKDGWNMYNIIETAKRLKELRVKAGKTQSQVADELGFCVDTVRKNEQGIRGLSVDQADMYAEYYGTTIDYIVNGNTKTDSPLDSLLCGYTEEMQSMALKILKGILDNLN